jgi:hypothetical protein
VYGVWRERRRLSEDESISKRERERMKIEKENRQQQQTWHKDEITSQNVELDLIIAKCAMILDSKPISDDESVKKCNFLSP